MDEKNLKIAYIGGGSKLWARVFMADLACAEGLGGEIALYDIDIPAAERNARIGACIETDLATKSVFKYRVYETIDDALIGADFVVISILPGTFREMRSDVHAPEEYGVFQPVGDTAGPGGVLRAMRTVPIYEWFAKKIKEVCPNAWVINFTNPMSICLKTLYDVFPGVKAFGCCHEVFHAQEFLCCVLRETKGIETDRTHIYTDASGVNHFTWITSARYEDIDLLALIPEFADRFFEEGYSEQGDRFSFIGDPFRYGNKVKMDMYLRYGALGAAGDRHLVEFMPNTWYLKDRQTISDWKIGLTTVDYRERQQAEKIAESEDMAAGKKRFPVVKSGEEAVDLMLAIMGRGTRVSNVNLPNMGQVPQLKMGAIVETNCVFSNGHVSPVISKPLPDSAAALVQRACENIEVCFEGIKKRDLEKIFLSFSNQALCSSLSMPESKRLFKEMCLNTREYLDPYYDLDSL